MNPRGGGTKILRKRAREECGIDYYAEPAFESLSRAAQRSKSAFNTQNIANCAWAFARAGSRDVALFDALARGPQKGASLVLQSLGGDAITSCQGKRSHLTRP